MLEASNISKEFGNSYFFKEDSNSSPILKGINFSLKKGESIGITGKNGSGKSTILRIVSGLILPDKGKIIIGNDCNISLINTNERSFYWRLTGMQNLEFFSKLYGIKRNDLTTRIKELDKWFHLEGLLKKEFMFLSAGQRKKLSIIRALIKEPDLLLCDEVTTSLDKESKEQVLEYLKNSVLENGLSMIWVSHIQSEISLLCTKRYELIEGILKRAQ